MHYLINVTAYVTVYTLVLVSVIRYKYRSLSSTSVVWLSMALMTETMCGLLSFAT